MSIKPILKTALNFGRKHLPKILAGGSIVANIAGYWFMHKKAPVVRKKLDELPPDAKFIDKVKVAAPIYAPAILMGAASCGCTIGAVAVDESRLSKMTTLAMTTATSLATAEQKLLETSGREEMMKYKEEKVKEAIKTNPPTAKNVIATEHGSDIFYDELSDRYFTSSKDFIMDAANRFNRDITHGADLSADVNEWYDMLDLPRCWLGKTSEWNVENLLDIQIGEWEGMPNEDRPFRPIIYFKFPVNYKGKEY